MNDTDPVLDLSYTDPAPPPDLATRAARRARSIRNRRRTTTVLVGAAICVMAAGGVNALVDVTRTPGPAGTGAPAPTQSGTRPDELLTVPDIVITFSRGVDPANPAPSTYTPPNPTDRASMGTDMASIRWRPDGNLSLVTYGPAGCPALPVTVTNDGGDIRIQTRWYTEAQGCHLDHSATTIVIAPPAGIDPTDATVVYVDHVKVNLAPMKVHPATATGP
jgi:hypothetical protein